jgi:hypothetical protein
MVSANSSPWVCCRTRSCPLRALSAVKTFAEFPFRKATKHEARYYFSQIFDRPPSSPKDD